MSSVSTANFDMNAMATAIKKSDAASNNNVPAPKDTGLGQLSVLPGELRNNIYAHLAKNIDLPSHGSLMLVSKHFAAECRFLLWRSNQHCPHLTITEDMLETIADARKQEACPEIPPPWPIAFPSETMTFVGFVSRYGCIEIHFKFSFDSMVQYSRGRPLAAPDYHLTPLGKQFKAIIKKSASTAYKREVERVPERDECIKSAPLNNSTELKIRTQWHYLNSLRNLVEDREGPGYECPVTSILALGPGKEEIFEQMISHVRWNNIPYGHVKDSDDDEDFQKE